MYFHSNRSCNSSAYFHHRLDLNSSNQQQQLAHQMSAEVDDTDYEPLDADAFEDIAALVQDLNAAATAAVAAGVKRPAKTPKRSKNPFPLLKEIYTTLVPDEAKTEKSTETGFRAIWHLWDAFCITDKPISDKPSYVQVFGLQLFPEREIFDSTTEQRLFDLAYTPTSFDFDRIVRFFSFLVEKKDPTSTNDTLTKAKGFLNSHLKWEFAARVKASGGKIHRNVGDIGIGDVTLIKNFVTTVRKRKAQEMLDMRSDILAEVDNTVSPEDEIKMMFQILVPVEAGQVQKLNSHYRLIFGATWTALRGTTRRGEECYNQKLIQRFTRVCPNIGPDGTECGFMLTVHCKHNTVGRMEYVAVAPHVNPLLCSNGWHGLLWIQVYVIDNAPFPNFDNFAEIYDIPTYHRCRDPRESIRDNTLNDIFNKNFHDAQIICDSVTHQPRRQTLQELDNKGVPLSSASRLSGHKNSSKDQGSKAQQESYLTNVPINAMVAAAGGDHTCPESHQPPRITVNVPDELLQLIFPALITTRRNVYARYRACTTHAERKERRLCTLKGCIDGMYLDVTRFLQMAASRFVNPKDPDTLERDSLTLQGRFKSAANGGAAFKIFNHTVFDSDVYKAFAARVHCAEDKYHALLDSEAPPLGPGQKKQQSKLAIQIDQRFILLSKQNSQQYSQHGSELSELRSMIQALVAGQSSFIASQSVPAAAPAPPMIPPQHNTSTPRHVVVPVPTSQASQYLKDGTTKRQRQPQLRQGDLLNLERAQGASEPGIERKELDDSRCFTFEEHYSLYKNEWKPLEDKHGNAWRADVKVNGKLKNSRTTWWGCRYPMYIYVDSAMHRLGLSEQAAIEEATKIFETVPEGSRSGRRCIKKLNKAFWAKLEEMGIENSKGTKKPNSTTQQARGLSQQARGPSQQACGPSQQARGPNSNITAPSRARVPPPSEENDPADFEGLLASLRQAHFAEQDAEDAERRYGVIDQERYGVGGQRLAHEQLRMRRAQWAKCPPRRRGTRTTTPVEYSAASSHRVGAATMVYPPDFRPARPGERTIGDDRRERARRWRIAKAEKDRLERLAMAKSGITNFQDEFGGPLSPNTRARLLQPRIPGMDDTSAQSPSHNNGCYYVRPRMSPLSFAIGAAIENPLQRHGEHAPYWGGYPTLVNPPPPYPPPNNHNAGNNSHY